MQRHIPSSVLRPVADLLAGNAFSSSDPALHLLDLMVRQGLWNDTLASAVAAFFDAAPLRAWRPRYRVRKRAFPASDPVDVPDLNGPESVINQPDAWQAPPGGGSYNYFVILVGEGLSVDPGRGVEIRFDPPSSDYDEAERSQLPLHQPDGTRALSDEASIRAASSAFFADLQGASGSAYLMFNSTTPVAGGERFGTFPVPVTAYIGFPPDGVIDYPRWFTDAPWSDAGHVEIVDRRLKFGGGAGGFAAYLNAGRTEISLPPFVQPLLRALGARAEVPIELPVVVGEFAANAIDENAPLPFEALALLALPFLGLWTLPAAFALGLTQIAIAQNLAVDPARGIGALDLRVVERSGRPAVAASLTLESVDAGVPEVKVIDGPDIEIHSLTVTVFFLPRVRASRLDWSTDVVVDADTRFAGRAALEQAVAAAVSGAIDPQMLTLPLAILFGLPILLDDAAFPATAADQAALGVGLNLVTRLITEARWRDPVLPSTLLPMNLLAVLDLPRGIDIQRAADRFVRYGRIAVAPDPDEPGSLRLEIDFERLAQHGRAGARLSHEVVPREGFEFRPLQLRLNDQEKPFARWMAYLQSGLAEVLRRLRGERRESPELGLPVLHLQYTLSTEHDGLPGGPAQVLSMQETRTLIDLPGPAGAPGATERDHFDGATLRPPTHPRPVLLELSSTLLGDTAAHDVDRVGRLHIEGAARLEYWRPKTPRGCGGVLLEILFEGLGRERAGRARGQSATPDGEPAAYPLTRETLEAEFQLFVLDLGTFAASVRVDDRTGLGQMTAAANGRPNVVTATGAMVDVDFVFDRATLGAEDLDWLVVSFDSFEVQAGTGSKGGASRDPQSDPLAALADGRRFDVVALVDGGEIGRAPFALRPHADPAVAAIDSGAVVPLGGGPWTTSLYLPESAGDDESFDVRFEVHTAAGLLGAVEATVLKRQSGDWADEREWGIPLGVAGTTLRLHDDDHALTAHVGLRNRVASADVPIQHVPKRLEVSAPRVEVFRDFDPVGPGELQYWLSVDRLSTDDYYTAVGRRKIFIQAAAGDHVRLDAPPLQGSFKPDSHLLLTAAGIEFDNPGFPWFNPNDWLSKASVDVPVGFDDGADGEHKIASLSEYALIADVRTLSPPPVPVLLLFDPAAMAFAEAVSLAPLQGVTELRLQVTTSWADELFLRVFDGDAEHPRQPWTQLVPAMPIGRYGSLPADVHVQLSSGPAAADFVYYYVYRPVPAATTRFQLLARNVAGSVVSRDAVFSLTPP